MGFSNDDAKHLKLVEVFHFLADQSIEHKTYETTLMLKVVALTPVIVRV